MSSCTNLVFLLKNFFSNIQLLILAFDVFFPVSLSSFYVFRNRSVVSFHVLGRIANLVFAKSYLLLDTSDSALQFTGRSFLIAEQGIRRAAHLRTQFEMPVELETLGTLQ